MEVFLQYLPLPQGVLTDDDGLPGYIEGMMNIANITL
jgi:hypothetical protein